MGWDARSLVMVAAQDVRFVSTLGDNYKILLMNFKNTFQRWVMGRQSRRLLTHETGISIESKWFYQDFLLLFLLIFLAPLIAISGGLFPVKATNTLTASDCRSTDQTFRKDSDWPSLNRKPISDQQFGPGVWRDSVGWLGSPASPCGCGGQPRSNSDSFSIAHRSVPSEKEMVVSVTIVKIEWFWASS